MIAMRFVGTSKHGVTFFFTPVDERSEYVFDGAFRYFRLRDVEIEKVSRPVATLDILYADEQRLTCLLPSNVAKELVECIKKDANATPDERSNAVSHFFTYHGFSRAVPFAWSVKSRYKTYDTLMGLT